MWAHVEPGLPPPPGPGTRGWGPRRRIHRYRPCRPATTGRLWRSGRTTARRPRPAQRDRPWWAGSTYVPAPTASPPARPTQRSVAASRGPRHCSCQRRNTRSPPASTSRLSQLIAGFEVSINCRFWVSTEGGADRLSGAKGARGRLQLEHLHTCGLRFCRNGAVGMQGGQFRRDQHDANYRRGAIRRSNSSSAANSCSDAAQDISLW